MPFSAASLPPSQFEVPEQLHMDFWLSSSPAGLGGVGDRD
jgi:hypothetical protein